MKKRILAVSLLLCLFLSGCGAGNRVTTISESTLEKVLEIEDLSTLEYTYNAVAEAYTDDNKAKLKYHVAYEGVVDVGINFSDISVSVDDKAKSITVTVPEAEVQSCRVDAGTLEYIFEKDKYETETVAQEAYHVALEDLESRVQEEDTMLEMARDNAISAVEGLISPWVEQLDDEYTVTVQ